MIRGLTNTKGRWPSMLLVPHLLIEISVDDPANAAYSNYATATAGRRDNLRRSAEELRAHLTQAERALRDLGDV
jgi:hypothetical protein